MTDVSDTATSEVRPSLTHQAAWLLVAKVAGFALTFALPLVLVRTLNRHDFGLYKQAFLLVGTAVTILPLGFGMTACYFLPREPERRGSVVLHVLMVHTILGLTAALVLTLWPGMLASAFGSAELAAYSRVLGMVVLTWTIASFLEIIPVARGDVRSSVYFVVGSQASKTLFFILAAMGVGSVGSLIYAALAQGIAQTAVLLWYLRTAFPGYRRSFDWTFLREQGAYAVPLGLSALLLRFQLDLPHYFIAHYFSASMYAIYAVGVTNVPLIGLLRESVGAVMLPRVSELEGRQQSGPIIELLARAANKLALVYFPIYAFLMVAGREFIAVLFTPQYLDSWPIFAVYLTLLPLGVLMFDPITRAYAAQRYFVLALRIGTLTATGLILWWGTPELGPLGVVTLVVALQIFATVASAWKLGRVMGIGRRELRLIGGLRKTALAAALSAAACAIARQMIDAPPLGILLVSAIVYFFTYAACVLAMDILTADEWALIRTFLPARPPAGSQRRSQPSA